MGARSTALPNSWMKSLVPDTRLKHVAKPQRRRLERTSTWHGTLTNTDANHDGALMAHSWRTASSLERNSQTPSDAMMR